MQLNIGKNLREIRKARDPTQEELAGILGVTYQTASKWERSEGYPDITMLPTIANYFGISLDDLAGMESLRGHVLRKDYLRRYTERCDRSEMAECIALLLWRAGNRKEAVKRAKRLPDLYNCMEMRLDDLLEGDERAAECLNTIAILGWAAEK